MNRKIIFVLKHDFMTRFMQDADMFEKFKFVGITMVASQNPSHHHLTAKEVLERAAKGDCHGYSTVGVIIPNIGAAFLPNHTVYSNGSHWAMVTDMCEAYGAALEY